MSTIYIAGAYAARDHLERVARRFAESGHPTTSSWLFEDHEIREGTLDAALDQSQQYVDDHVDGDFEDVRRADALVLFTTRALLELDLALEGKTRSGGRHVETGYALALGKPVVVIGEPENIFHRGSQIRLVPNVTEAIRALTALEILSARGSKTLPTTANR